MPVLQLYQHGLTAGCPPTGRPAHMPAKRDVVQGWTSKTTRSNTAFLRSVVLDGLTGVGITFTLTVQECPSTSDEWHKMRRAMVERLRRAGFIRLHWVVEWQKRGYPHLHGMVYFPHCDGKQVHQLRDKVTGTWCEIAEKYGAKPWAQHTAVIIEAVGWLKYLAKHAARGVNHYQRSPENIPPQWCRKTGRVWGHLGDWPCNDAIRISLTQPGYYAFRRLVRAYRVADARASACPVRIRSARRMLACSDRAASAFRGLSEWAPIDLQIRMLECLAAQGYDVTQG